MTNLECRFNMESLAFVAGERRNIFEAAVLRALEIQDNPEISAILEKAVESARSIPSLKYLRAVMVNPATTAEIRIDTAKRIANAIYPNLVGHTFLRGGTIYKVTGFQTTRAGGIVPLAAAVIDDRPDADKLAAVLATGVGTEEEGGALARLYAARHSNLAIGSIIRDQARRFYKIDSYKFDRETGEFTVYGFLLRSDSALPREQWEFSKRLSEIEWARRIDA